MDIGYLCTLCVIRNILPYESFTNISIITISGLTGSAARPLPWVPAAGLGGRAGASDTWAAEDAVGGAAVGADA